MEVLQDLSTAKYLRCSQTKQSNASSVFGAAVTEFEWHFHTETLHCDAADNWTRSGGGKKPPLTLPSLPEILTVFHRDNASCVTCPVLRVRQI
jgi:hypothetical protein